MFGICMYEEEKKRIVFGLTDADYADYLALLVNTLAQAEPHAA